MLKYIVKRIVLGIVTIWAVATITFFLMNLVPGGPFLSEKAISAQATAALEAKYGLDKPMIQRYTTYMWDALHGDFGDSLKQRGRTVMDIIGRQFPVSARLGGVSVLVALFLGVPLGCIAALKRGKFTDSFISVVATCGIAVPSFVICTVLMYFFGVKLRWFPTMGLTTWKNSPNGKILKSDIVVAKNYLDKEEITELNNLVSMYLDYAERQVKLKKIISMKEWKEKLELFLKLNEYNILKDNGKIKKEIADSLAMSEYEKYRVIQDKEYLSDFDELIEFSKKENIE